MRISDLVARYIMDMLDENDGGAEIKRNELAETIGCVPSQINYVITSRFTPEQGYIVESRRGGGGYIRITRVQMDKRSAVMHLINLIGDSVDTKTAAAVVKELLTRNLISLPTAKIITSAIADRPYQSVPVEYRDKLRAAVLKNMLLSLEE
ncbi:MAG: CtsR family transcriptional regulator [Clostridia bacterium]|nr:CtsR family transcriptional regulator [Clostridia bacterium]